MTRKTKLEKAMADLPKRQFTLRGDPSDESSWKWEVNPPPQAFWDDGLYVDVDEMEFRLAPMHAALIEAVEALEEFADFDNQYEPKMVCWPASEYMKKSRKALAKIDEALDQQTKNSNS